MPSDSFGRRSSDWSEEEPRSKKAVRLLAQRAWLIIVPLIGVGFYNARYLTPAVKDMDAKIATERQELEAQRTKTLSDARRVGVKISALSALADTFEVRFLKIDALIDSVNTLRESDLADLKQLEAEGDSLRAIYSHAAGRSSELAALLPPMQARIDSLKATITGWEDTIRKLEAEKAADTDLAERILRPNLFRKNTALVTGPGEFPNRDALPKR